MERLVFLDQVLFVIVLYKNKLEDTPAFCELQRLNTKTKQRLSIFVYDNSPTETLLNHLPIIYHHDPENNGVSKAYNTASVYAQNMKKKWMMFLDQDTTPAKDFDEMFFNAVQQNPSAKAFVPRLVDRQGLLSPFKWWIGKGWRITSPKISLDLGRFRFVNSGLLIDLQVFQQVQGYDEAMPLDFSDIAFGNKLLSVTDHFVVIESTWQHSFSGTSKNHLDEASLRFDFFCAGLFRMAKLFRPSPLLFFYGFIRSVKLGMQYKTLHFVRTLLKQGSK